MREESSAVRGMFILSMAGIIAKVLSLFYVPMLIGILGDEGYGIYQQSTEVFVFVYAITCMGAQPAVAKVVTELTALDNPKGAIRALQLSRKFYSIIGGVLGLLMMLLAFPIADLSGHTSMAYGIIALGPCVLITSILATYRGYMQGRSNMTSIAISQVLEQILNVVVSLLFAFILRQISLPLGSAGGQIGTSVGAMFACFYLIYCYDKKNYREEAMVHPSARRKASDKKILRKIIMYSVPITISAGLQNFGGLVDMVNVMSRLSFAGFSETEGNILYSFLGRYKTLYGVPLIVITAIGTTVLPAISRSVVLNEKKEVKKKISYAFRLTFAIAIPSAVGLGMLSNLVYFSIYGNDNGAKIMTLGSFILVLMAMTQIQSIVLQSINKLYYILGTFSIGILFKIVLNYIFVGIADINVYGVLIGNCFWHLIPAILNHKKICSTMRMRLSVVKLVTKPILASSAMAITLYILKLPLPFLYRFVEPSRFISIPLTIIMVMVGGVVYLYLMILMGGIRKRDIETISPKVMRLMPRFMRMKLK